MLRGQKNVQVFLTEARAVDPVHESIALDRGAITTEAMVPLFGPELNRAQIQARRVEHKLQIGRASCRERV